jgi:hypothetical protein
VIEGPNEKSIITVPEPGTGSKEEDKDQEQDERDVDSEDGEHPLCLAMR